MDESKKIWLTRPQDDSEHFAAELAYHHIASLVAPVMHVVRKPLSALPMMPDALLLTSRHAAYALGDLPTAWRALPTYCVGAATARYASDYHFSNIIPGTSDIMALIPKLLAQVKPGQTLLYLSGDETRADIPKLIGTQGVTVETTYVYSAIAESRLPETLIQELQAGTIRDVAFFSPRSASIACDLLKAAKLDHCATSINAYCLSLNVASDAGTLPWASLRVCHVPTRRSMRELILSHHQHSG